MKYAKQHDIPLVKKTTPRTFGSIKPGEKFRIKYKTEPFWVVNYIYKEKLVFDVFERWKPIYLGIPWFRKWNPKIDWRSMQVTIKSQLYKIKKRLVGAKNIGTFARKNQTNCDELATLEFIPPKYKEYNDVFEKPEKGFPLPKHSENDHEIVLEAPKKLATGFIYNTNEKKNENFSGLYRKKSQKNYIRHSKSRVTQPVMFVPKKNGELKMCVDYRRINAVTVKNKYPLPLMADMKTKLRDARYFTILDLRNALNFIKKKIERKTAFRTKYGIYEYLVMPFGLTNTPVTIQKMVNKALQSYLDRFAIIYMDDILVYSDIYDQHIRHVRMVLDALKQKNLKIKTEKCKFHVKEITFLGFIITPKNIQMETTKINNIQTWPAPKNIKKL